MQSAVYSYEIIFNISSRKNSSGIFELENINCSVVALIFTISKSLFSLRHCKIKQI